MHNQKTAQVSEVRPGLVHRLLRHPAGALAAHWLAQGIFAMDTTELWFKLGLDLILALGIGVVLNLVWPGWAAWPVALLAAHTMNFIFNAQIIALLKNYGIIHWRHADFITYVRDLSERAQRERAIQELRVCGSLSRNNWSSTSDLDARILRRPGLLNGLRACWFTLRERTRALFAGFPLDMFVLDSERLLSRLHPGEKALPIEEVIAQEKAERSGAAPAGIPVAAPGVVYLRGAYASGFGQTSYRIAYHLPEFGLRTTLVLLGPHTARSRAGDTDILVVGMPGVPFLGAAWVQIATLFHLLSMKCDALVCNPGIFLCGWLYKLLRPHTPLIVDIRSVPVEVDGLYARFIDWTFTWSVRSQALDGLSVITAGMLADIQNRYGARRDLPCVVWASGVDGDLFDPSISGERVRARYGLQDTFVLMYHGTLSAGRGLSDAVKAVALLAQDGEQRVKLVFIGKGVHQSQLAELAETLKVADKVLFLPPVPHEQIPAYVAAADAGIDPLPDHPWWNYSSSMKVYEYLRMGKPVFATDIPAHHGISPALLLAPGRDPAALANSIKSWMSAGTAEREALRQAALESGASNTWRARAEVLALFLKRNFLKSGGQ